jgi:AbrB family looped-hinge helix DNA binding protein
MKTTIDRAGRLVIPKGIRELAGLKPGMELDVDYRYGSVVIEPVSKSKLVRKGSFLVSRVPGAPKMTLAQSNRLIRRLRDGLL